MDLTRPTVLTRAPSASALAATGCAGNLAGRALRVVAVLVLPVLVGSGPPPLVPSRPREAVAA